MAATNVSEQQRAN